MKPLIVELLPLNVLPQSIQRLMNALAASQQVAEETSAIIIKDLVKQFDEVTAIDGLNLDIRQGELFSLLGPNGALHV